MSCSAGACFKILKVHGPFFQTFEKSTGHNFGAENPGFNKSHQSVSCKLLMRSFAASRLLIGMRLPPTSEYSFVRSSNQSVPRKVLRCDGKGLAGLININIRHFLQVAHEAAMIFAHQQRWPMVQNMGQTHRLAVYCHVSRHAFVNDLVIQCAINKFLCVIAAVSCYYDESIMIPRTTVALRPFSVW